ARRHSRDVDRHPARRYRGARRGAGRVRLARWRCPAPHERRSPPGRRRAVPARASRARHQGRAASRVEEGDLVKVVIAGAGSVGRSIARELLESGHEITLVEKQPGAMRVAQVAEAQWLLADACELSTLTEAGVEQADVVVAATGDDKANLVISL